jgi:O-antigen/teichoic acid export membrane protein
VAADDRDLSTAREPPAAETRDPGLTRNVAVTTGTLVVARGIALIAGIATISLASRYLGLSHFGALTTAMAYASLFALVTDLGLSTVATREIARDPAREHHVLGNVLGVGMLCSVASAGIGLALMEAIYSGPANAATRDAIVILLLQVFAAPFSGAARAFFAARQQGYLIAAGDLALAAGMAAFTAIAVVGHLGFRGVVIGITGGYVAQAVVMMGVALTRGVRVGYDRRAGGQLVRMALPLAGTLLINYLYFRLDVLLLSWIKTDADVARYGLAYRVLEGLMVLPGYLMLALFPTIARSADGDSRLSVTIGSALTVLEAIGVPLAALMAIFSPEIVVLLGGHKYASAAPVLAILSLALFLSYVNGVFGNALMAMGRQRRLFWLASATLGVNVIVNLVLIPPLGPNGAAIAVVISEVVGVALVRRYYVQVAGPPASTAHRRIIAAGGVLAVLAAVKFALPLGSDPLLVATVGGLLGIVVYGALLLRLGVLPESITRRIPSPSWLVPTHPSS